MRPQSQVPTWTASHVRVAGRKGARRSGRTEAAELGGGREGGGRGGRCHRAVVRRLSPLHAVRGRLPIVPRRHRRRHRARARSSSRAEQIRGHHGVESCVDRYGHGLLALLHVEKQVEAAGADFGQLAEHDVLGDAFHRVDLAVAGRVQEHVHCLLEGAPVEFGE